MIKGIIFDLDGTTLSTLEDIKNSLNTILERHGYPTKTYDEVRMLVGNGSRNLIRNAIPDGSDEELVADILKEYVEDYSINYHIETKPYEGIPELLKKLQEKGILMAINSNKPDRITKALIAESFPDIDFLEVTGQRDDLPRKPDPTQANKTVELMGLNKEEVLYIGDSETDIKTAKNAELKSVGCLWGFRDRQTLEDSGADHIVSCPEEIIELLGER
ncbi:MAG: HAD family hydrolase [Erysipelotrichaceae bacterium]|nr:HAD family hydrolase [Erysipelotrichaceae bacterium]